jgi:integrase
LENVENLNISANKAHYGQVCALKKAKNLIATESKTVAGEESQTQQEAKGKMVQFALALRNKGRTAETIRTYVGALYTLSNRGANLLDPTNVEEVIAKQEKWTQRAKRNYTDWYARFAKFLHIEWEKPNYKAPNKTPFIPLESEIDQLISGSSRKVSIALAIGKETAARIGEVVRLKWTDIDPEANSITINEPEKGSNTEVYKVPAELIARIMMLPKTSERILGKASTDSITNMLTTAKRRLATSFCNPRLARIHFHTLRHWKLTAYAHAIKDPFQVQLFARHKDMKCTMRYIHLERILYQKSDNDEWTVRAVKTVEEASELVKVGFEYVTEIEGFKLFRKRK